MMNFLASCLRRMSGATAPSAAAAIGGKARKRLFLRLLNTNASWAEEETLSPPAEEKKKKK